MAEEPRDEMMEELFGTSDNDSDDDKQEIEQVSIPHPNLAEKASLWQSAESWSVSPSTSSTPCTLATAVIYSMCIFMTCLEQHYRLLLVEVLYNLTG